ncbi:DUF6913 domain-containing protein [Psychroflexus curvus]|uniref:DUF6913 domain-containing protein n=1 Tax=Psychroflexus curvus TaxID=2873595 RepID=UPI00396A74F7
MLNSVQTYFIKKNLKPSKSPMTGDRMSMVGVLFNADVSDRNQLREHIEHNFDEDSSKLIFLGFSRKNYEKEKKSNFIFTKKDFSLLGQPRSEVITEFLKHNYKLLFNFFGENEHYLENIAQLAQANLKVGLCESSEKINDLLLDLESKDLRFFEESSKYIKHII